MIKKLRPLCLFVLILLLVGVACTLPVIGNKSHSTSEATQANEGGETGVTAENPLQNLLPQPSPTAINSRPVGVQEGLGSLDSYTVAVHVVFSNSDGSKSDTTETIDRDVTNSKSHSVMKTISREKGESEDSTSDQEIISSGLVTCTKNDETWDYSEVTDQEKEMEDIFKQMVDFTPLIDNPTFVGEEEVNGVQTNHFTFEVSGIGKNSGSVATINQGDYWLAVDGQYIVKYQLDLELHSAANGSSDDQVSVIRARFNLTNINQPQEIELPSGCAPSAQ